MAETKIKEAQEILIAIGMPSAQSNELAALTLLALCQIKESEEWKNARNPSLGVTKGIMQFVNEHYNRSYAPNTRETFRRFVLHQFEQGRIVNYNPDNPSLPVNSPKAHYALTRECLDLVQRYGTSGWEQKLSEWKDSVPALRLVYEGSRDLERVPIYLSNGQTLSLSAGKHNEVQAAIVHEFCSRFAKGGMVLYVGDTENKDLYQDKEQLQSLGIPINEHSKLPDIVIYDPERYWLYLIEAVTSHGSQYTFCLCPMSPVVGNLTDCRPSGTYPLHQLLGPSWMKSPQCPRRQLGAKLPLFSRLLQLRSFP